MTARFEAAIRFTCPKCSRKTDATVVLDEPDWFDDDLNSKAFRGKATVTCPACKTLFPASSSLQGDQLDAVTLDDFPETDINIVQQPGFIDPDDYDFPDDYPEEPYQIFKDSYNHTRELLTEHGQEHGDYLLNRMVFAQQVASLEAYLGDTIRKAMHWDETAAAKLASACDALSDQKVTLSAIASNPNLVLERVNNYLKSILYHDLVNVDRLYKSSLGIRILKDKSISDKLIEAISYRHDCVHRNGFDKDGKRLNVFTRKYVQGLADTMSNLVDRIESEVVYQQYYGHPLPKVPATPETASS
jgi:hypothetical protein